MSIVSDENFTFRGAEEKYEEYHKAGSKSIQSQIIEEILNNRATERALNFRISYKCHQTYTTRINKVCLSCYDDKRYLCGNGLTILPYRQFEIAEDCFYRQILNDMSWATDLRGMSSGGETVEYLNSSTPEQVSSANHINESFTSVAWGFLQRQYSLSELEDISSDNLPDSSTPDRNEFILSETKESPETPHSKKRKRKRLFESDFSSN